MDNIAILPIGTLLKNRAFVPFLNNVHAYQNSEAYSNLRVYYLFSKVFIESIGNSIRYASGATIFKEWEVSVGCNSWQEKSSMFKVIKLSLVQTSRF
jgi:hypothetical protein